MLIFICVLCIILLLAIFAVLQKWQVTVRYRNGAVTVYFGKFRVFRSGEDKDEKDNKYIRIPKLTLSSFKAKLRVVQGLYRDEKHDIIAILKDSERRLDFKTFDIAITFGFGDAAVTGIANGIIWSCVTSVIEVMKKHVDIDKKTNIALHPEYSESCFEADVLLIFHVRPVSFIPIINRIKQLLKRNEDRLEFLKN